MAQTLVQRYIGIHSADAERVSLVYRHQDLSISYVDWQDVPRTVSLGQVLSFKWQERDMEAAPRDDTSFQVLDSTWLHEQTHGMPGTESLVHYKILFNACGVLDVICGEVTIDAKTERLQQPNSEA